MEILDASKLRLNPEHKEFARDLTNVIISYTPISGLFDTLKFSHKWFGKRRVGHRIHRHLSVQGRRMYIKSRSRKIIGKHRKPDFYDTY
jgi:hypothetical protein